MTMRHRTTWSAQGSSSRHISRDEAIDRLYWLLGDLDPAHEVPWGAIERVAVSPVPDDELPWRLAEGAELVGIVAGLREHRRSAA